MPKLGMEEIRTAQVVEATMRGILEKGFSNLSVKHIAAEAQISTGIIYHYFKNKEDLLLQVIKEAFVKSHQQVIDTVEHSSDPKEKLIKYIENLYEVPQDNPEFFTILLNYLGQVGSSDEINRIVNKFLKNIISYITGLIDDGVKAGEVASDRVEHLPALILALGIGMGILRTVLPETVGGPGLKENLIDIIDSYI